MSRFSVEKFLSQSAEKFRRGASLCFKKYPVAKKFMVKRGGGGVSGFSVDIFSSHSAENFRRGTF